MGVVTKPYTFTNGVGNLIDAPQVNADFDTLYTLVNGNLQAVNLKAGDGLFDSYRDVASAEGYAQGGATAADSWWSVAGPPIPESVDALAGARGILRFALADYAVVGKTMKLRMQSVALVNAVAPGMTFTPALFPITSVTGGGGTTLRLNITLGPAVAGSGVAITTPAANSVNAVASGDFTPPADGNYLIGVTLSGSPAANSIVSVGSRLQIRAT